MNFLQNKNLDFYSLFCYVLATLNMKATGWEESLLEFYYRHTGETVKQSS